MSGEKPQKKASSGPKNRTHDTPSLSFAPFYLPVSGVYRLWDMPMRMYAAHGLDWIDAHPYDGVRAYA